MDIDIYTRTTIRDTYVFVPKGVTPPAHTGAAAFWKTRTYLPGSKANGVNADEVLADIARQGFAIVGAAVVVDVSIQSPPAG